MPANPLLFVAQTGLLVRNYGDRLIQRCTAKIASLVTPRFVDGLRLDGLADLR